MDDQTTEQYSRAGEAATLIDGRYALGRVVGRGGMGVVYEAIDIRLDRPVAVKVLAESPIADRARFEAEARMLASFVHPHLVRVLDAGEFEGRLYLVMDLVEGPTLAAMLANRAIDADTTLSVARGVTSALAYAHRRGIVHRDVKPANILIDRDGEARLADFGIARLVDTTGMTATGLTLGTPAYLAPEQVSGGEIGPAVDVYALGLVLIECVSGVRAFAGTPAEVAAARLQRAPAIPDISAPGWVPLLRAMTAIEPAVRIAASDASEQVAHLDPPAAVEPSTLVMERSDGGTVVMPVAELQQKVLSVRGRGLVVGGALLALALIGWLIGWGVEQLAAPKAPRPSLTSDAAPAPVIGAAQRLLTLVRHDQATTAITSASAASISSAVQPLLTGRLKAAQEITQLHRVARAWYSASADGGIPNASVATGIGDDISNLAGALGTTMPTTTTEPTRTTTATTTTTAVPPATTPAPVVTPPGPAGSPPGPPGHGHGHRGGRP